MAKKFSIDELLNIGKQCGNKLPPASAVQAMFLYEMKRQTEVEKLFHETIFKLSKAEQQAPADGARLTKIEDALQALRKKTEVDLETIRKQLKTKEVHERVQVDTLHATLDIHIEVVNGHRERLRTLEEDVKALQERDIEHTAQQTEAADNKHDELITALVEKVEALDLELGDVDKEIAILFDERDGIVGVLDSIKDGMEAFTKQLAHKVDDRFNDEELDGVQMHYLEEIAKIGERHAADMKKMQDRMDKLEDLVRALTSQRASSTSPAPSSPAARSHAVAITTPDGRALSLSVPKGKAFSGLKKENIRTFVPGKTWA